MKPRDAKHLKEVIAKPEDDTPERFERLTQHLRVSGKPLESKIFALQADRAKGLQMPVKQK